MSPSSCSHPLVFGNFSKEGFIRELRLMNSAALIPLNAAEASIDECKDILRRSGHEGYSNRPTVTEPLPSLNLFLQPNLDQRLIRHIPSIRGRLDGIE